MALDEYPLQDNPALFEQMSAIAQRTFLILEKAWQLVGGRLVDLKIEFGFDQRGNLVLADVIDNDSWRVLCDGKYIDKQVYRDGADLETVAKLYANVAALTSRFSSCVNTINAQQTTYKMAGVDVAAGNRFVELIAPLTKTTSRVGVDAVLGGFSSAFDIAKTNYKDPIILSTTDGVGTKLKIAESLHDHSTIGIDLVAMCVNDLIVHGAEPILFLDYFATGSLILDDAVCVIQGIVDGCKQAGCALAGGETAEMPGMYRGGEYDLAGFAIGIAERSHLLPKLESIIPGDVIIGLASSGIHANGFSLIRHLIQLHDIDLSGPAPFLTDYKSLGQALLAPTKIYFTSLLPLIRQDYIKALAHITGGGFLENIPRVLPKHCSVELDVNCWEIPPVFAWIAQLGNVSFDEMTRTFNMGIGMIAVVDQCYASLVLDALQHSGQACYRIGTVIKTDETPHVIIRNEPF
jgi:phosphoribosylaminoimidazole synthetase